MTYAHDGYFLVMDITDTLDRLFKAYEISRNEIIDKWINYDYQRAKSTKGKVIGFFSYKEKQNLKREDFVYKNVNYISAYEAGRYGLAMYIARSHNFFRTAEKLKKIIEINDMKYYDKLYISVEDFVHISKYYKGTIQ